MYYILENCFVVFGLIGVMNCTEEAPDAQNRWDTRKKPPRVKLPGDWLVTVCLAGTSVLVDYGGHGADINTLGGCSSQRQDPLLSPDSSQELQGKQA